MWGMHPKPYFLAYALAAIVGCSIASAQVTLSVNLGNTGTASVERGVAFDLTNNSTSESVVFTGLVNLAVTTTVSEGFVLWTRTGTVLNNIGAGATNWTDRGSATATGQGYGSPAFALTSYTFASFANVVLAPGETMGIYIKDSNQSASLRYANANNPVGNTITNSTGFTSGSITYTGIYGLTQTGATPLVTNSLGGPSRNFIGEIQYNVIPEPATFAALTGFVALAWGATRRRGRLA